MTEQQYFKPVPPSPAPGTRFYTEDPEGINVNRWRIETMTRRFLDAREHRLSWEWIAVLLATAPVVLSDTLTATVGNLGPTFWRVVFGVLALYSGVIVIRTGFASLVWWLYEHEGQMPKIIQDLFVKKPEDWCSLNVAAFVTGLVRDIEAEDRSRRERQQPVEVSAAPIAAPSRRQIRKVDPEPFDPDEIPF